MPGVTALGPSGIFPSRSQIVIKNLIARFVREDAGQDLIEYAFLAVFIALVVTAALSAVATGINTQMTNISNQVVGS
jgi:Flp pilus assembly pilin Flp